MIAAPVLAVPKAAAAVVTPMFVAAPAPSEPTTALIQAAASNSSRSMLGTAFIPASRPSTKSRSFSLIFLLLRRMNSAMRSTTSVSACFCCPPSCSSRLFVELDPNFAALAATSLAFELLNSSWAFFTPLANGDDILVRLNLARPAIVRVLEADRPRVNEMIVVWPNEAAQLLCASTPALPSTVLATTPLSWANAPCS